MLQIMMGNGNWWFLHPVVTPDRCHTLPSFSSATKLLSVQVTTISYPFGNAFWCTELSPLFQGKITAFNEFCPSHREVAVRSEKSRQQLATVSIVWLQEAAAPGNMKADQDNISSRRSISWDIRLPQSSLVGLPAASRPCSCTRYSELESFRCCCCCWEVVSYLTKGDLWNNDFPGTLNWIEDSKKLLHSTVCTVLSSGP